MFLTMGLRLQQASESGSIVELYALIKEDPYILDKIDAVPYIDTPLHVAAASGNRAFAVEMMNLKPSFGRKLNTSGYSPLHLAVENDHGHFVIGMLRLDNGLARVKGRNGITPFLLLVERGKADLVAECLLRTPECIEDVSVKHQNALHLAVIKDRIEVLQVLTGWIQRNGKRGAYNIEYNALNDEDFNSNTPLHFAANKNDHQAARLLLECRRVMRNKVNGNGLTFLDILRNHGHNAGGDLEQVALKTGCKQAASLPNSKTPSDILKSPFTYCTFRSTFMRRLRSNVSDENRGMFLVVCVLIITATYQTALQPPGGVHSQSEGGNVNVTTTNHTALQPHGGVHQSDGWNAYVNAGSVVMELPFYIFLWFFNTVGFCYAMIFTYVLIPADFELSVVFLALGASLCVSYAIAMTVISPNPPLFLSLTFFYFLLFSLVVFFEIPLARWRHYFR